MNDTPYNPKQVSKCCESEMRVCRGCDADEDHREKPCNCKAGTAWYECLKCGKPCDGKSDSPKQPSRSAYWDALVDIVDRNFEKGKCAERGKALVLLAEIEMLLQGKLIVYPDEKPEPTLSEEVIEIDKRCGYIHRCTQEHGYQKLLFCDACMRLAGVRTSKQVRHELAKKICEELEKIKKWPEPKANAGEGLGALAGTGMYIQYDADRKKHNKEISQAIEVVKELGKVGNQI